VIIDVIVIFVLLFAFSIIVFYAGTVMHEVNDIIQEDEEMPNASKVIMADLTGKYCPNWDGMIFSILVVLWLAALVTAWMIDTNPFYFIVAIILLIFVFYVAMEIGNTYNDLTGDDSDFACYQLTNFIFLHSLQFIMVMGFTIIIVLYTKLR
jgi:hypothetical protein